MNSWLQPRLRTLLECARLSAEEVVRIAAVLGQIQRPANKPEAEYSLRGDDTEMNQAIERLPLPEILRLGLGLLAVFFPCLCGGAPMAQQQKAHPGQTKWKL